jgi:hypothetical protein
MRRQLLTLRQQLPPLTESALAECLTTQKRYKEAEPLLLRSYPAMKSNVGERDPRTAETLGRLATLYEAWGKPQDVARYRPARPRAATERAHNN